MASSPHSSFPCSPSDPKPSRARSISRLRDKSSPFGTLIAFAVVLSLACAFVTNNLPGGAGSKAFSARATSPVSVDLEWALVGDATGYRIEVGFEGLDFFTIDEVAGDQTRYTVFVLPGVTDITYRLVAVTEAGESEVGTSAVNMPALAPDPLTVTVNVFEPTVVPLPTYDPNNPMGSFPPGFDPEHPEDFDPSSLMQQMSAAEEIGPEGGRVSVTAPDQVTYTLDVPAGAVAQPVFFTLTPVESVDGLPFSGGLMGAVRIQPEGMSYDAPAILTIDRPSATTNASAPLTIGFAVSPFSREFYLHPLAHASTSSTGIGRLADVLPYPLAQSTSTRMNVGGGGTFGAGAGSSADVQHQAQRVPTDAGEQVAQHDAAQQSVRPQASADSLAMTAVSILSQLPGAKTASRLDSAASQLEQYWEDGGSKGDARLNASLLRSFASRIKDLIAKAKGDCVTRDDLVAADLATKLSEAASDFWKQVAETYRGQFGVDGQTVLKELTDGKFSCRITLELSSTIKIEDALGWELAQVQTTLPMILLHDRRGRLSPTSYRLSGFGSATYVNYEFKNKGCPVTKVTQYPTIPIYFTGVYPEFDDSGRLSDLQLTMWELGAGFSLHVDVAIARDKKGCDVTMGIMGGGDVWSGGFVLMHFPDGIKQWTETSSSYPIQYTKAYVNQSVTIPGGITVTETGTYTITIRRGDGG